MKHYLILIALACLLTSCNHSLNGRYVVAAIKAGDNGNDTISNYLKRRLTGEQYDITIDSSTTTLRSFNYHTQMTLQRSKYYKHATYVTSFQASDATFEVMLHKDTGLTLNVTMRLPSDKPLVLPVQYGGFNITDLTRKGTKHATVECYLSKVSN